VIAHLWTSTLVLAVALIAARIVPMTARTRCAVLTLALLKLAIPVIPLPLHASHAAAMPLRFLGGPRLAPPAPASHWPLVVQSVWIAVALLLAVRWAVIRHRTIRTILARTSEPSPREQRAFATLQARAALRRSAALDSPAVVGILRPTVVLPDCHTLDDGELAALLAHEAAHVRRRDNLRGVIESLLAAAFWFHPLVWLLRRDIARAREEACDEAVADAQPVETYAAALAKVCRAALAARVAGVSCMANGQLKGRIDHLMRYHDLIRRAVPHRLALAAAAVLIAATTFAADTPQVPYALNVTAEAAGNDTIVHAVVTEVGSGAVATKADIRLGHGTDGRIIQQSSGRTFTFQTSGKSLLVTVTENGKLLQKTSYTIDRVQGDGRRYTGEPISLSLKRADVRDVLKTFGHITGYDIDIAPDVTGSVTMELHEIPWDKALDLIAQQNGLAIRVEGKTIHVARQ
jgi:beta-lactamase regulating signal transducer with metallopeptidase domain